MPWMKITRDWNNQDLNQNLWIHKYQNNKIELGLNLTFKNELNLVYLCKLNINIVL